MILICAKSQDQCQEEAERTVNGQNRFHCRVFIAADSQCWPPMTPKVLATILMIVQWRPRQHVKSFCRDREDVCASRGRTRSPRRPPTQVEPDSHEERLARVRQLVRQPRQRMAPGLREVQAATQVFRHLAERVGWIRKVDPPSLLELRCPARTPCTQDGMHCERQC